MSYRNIEYIITASGIDGDAVINIVQVDLDFIIQGSAIIGNLIGIFYINGVSERKIESCQQHIYTLEVQIPFNFYPTGGIGIRSNVAGGLIGGIGVRRDDLQQHFAGGFR